MIAIALCASLLLVSPEVVNTVQTTSPDRQKLILTSAELPAVRLQVIKKYLPSAFQSPLDVDTKVFSISLYILNNRIVKSGDLSFEVKDVKIEAEQLSILGSSATPNDIVLLGLKRNILVVFGLKSAPAGRILELNREMVGLDQSGELETWIYPNDYQRQHSVTYRPVGETGIKFVCLGDLKIKCTMTYSMSNNVFVTAIIPSSFMYRWREVKGLIAQVVQIDG